MPAFVASNLPMDQLEILRPQYNVLAKLQDKRCVVRYRGPRFDPFKATCLKRNARYWAVYFY